MKQILIPSLYGLSGICAYSAVSHVVASARRPFDAARLVFAGMCVLVFLFAVTYAQASQALDLAGFVAAQKWNLVSVLLFFMLLPWFIALYTERRPLPLLIGLNVVFLALLVVNFTKPYGLQYERIGGLATTQLPWGETLTHASLHQACRWFYVAMAGVAVVLGYGFCALVGSYRERRSPATLQMIAALGVMAACAVEGILVRLSIIDFALLGSFGYLALVLAMSGALRHERVQTLHAALRDAQAAARAKQEFLATLSHEIRTPLNGVLGMLGLLKTTQLRPEQQDYLGAAQESAESLQTLLDDLVQFSELEARRVDLVETDFNPASLVGDVVRVLRRLAEPKGVTVDVNLQAALDRTFIGDSIRLRQVVAKLVSNAIKFTDAGAVNVSGSVAEAEEGRVRMRIDVQDTGIGIDPGSIEEMFEPFTQEDSSTTRRHGGAGLGLATCKALVERMGGSIGAESQAGRGSHFWFTVELRPGAVQGGVP